MGLHTSTKKEDGESRFGDRQTDRQPDGITSSCSSSLPPPVSPPLPITPALMPFLSSPLDLLPFLPSLPWTSQPDFKILGCGYFPFLGVALAPPLSSPHPPFSSRHPQSPWATHVRSASFAPLLKGRERERATHPSLPPPPPPTKAG